MAASRIFLSYTSDASHIARDLAKALIGRGFEVWVDASALHVGDSIADQVAAGVHSCEFFVPLVSEAWHLSRYCKYELAMAMDLQIGHDSIRVLPVRMAGASLPASLTGIKCLDLDAGSIDAVADAIATAVDNDIDAASLQISEQSASMSTELDG
jgi:hypothetical protein